MNLVAQKRKKLGTSSVDKMRSEGLIPAELYGKETENIHLAVNEGDFRNIYKEAGESTIINLSFDGDERAVLIYDVQNDPISGLVKHVDFFQVKMGEKLQTEVPLVFVGESDGVKTLGGILITSLQSLHIESLPKDLPREIEVDISALKELDSTLYIKDLNLPEGVEATVGLDTAVVSVVTPKEEVEEAISEEESIEAVKVEGEDKKDEKDEEIETSAE